MMRFTGPGMPSGWGPLRRGPSRPVIRNVRSAKSLRRWEERCNELESQLTELSTEHEHIASKNDEYRNKIDEYETQLSRLQSEILRSHSDAQRNRKLAVEKEEQAAEKARVEVASRIMSVADDFANALEVAEEQEMDSKWFDGFKAMAEKVDSCLVTAGYRRFESLGEEMDPSRHEALATMPAPEDMDGKVIQVVESGYEDMKTSKVVRVAKVLVGRSDGDA